MAKRKKSDPKADPAEYRATDREKTAWYFQRWVEHLPAADEFVLFNRS